MALNGLELELGAGHQADVCVDSMVLGLMQRTDTLEEKVDQLFELLRDPIYLRSEEHTSELQSRSDLVCRLLLEKKNKANTPTRLSAQAIAPQKQLDMHSSGLGTVEP